MTDFKNWTLPKALAAIAAAGVLFGAGLAGGMLASSDRVSNSFRASGAFVEGPGVASEIDYGFSPGEDLLASLTQQFTQACAGDDAKRAALAEDLAAVPAIARLGASNIFRVIRDSLANGESRDPRLGRYAAALMMVLEQSPQEVQTMVGEFEGLAAKAPERGFLLSTFRGLKDGQTIVAGIAERAARKGAGRENLDLLIASAESGEPSIAVSAALNEIVRFSGSDEEVLGVVRRVSQYKLSGQAREAAREKLSAMLEFHPDEALRTEAFQHALNLSGPAQRHALVTRSLRGGANTRQAIYAVSAGTVGGDAEIRGLLMNIARNQDHPGRAAAIEALMHRFSLKQDEYRFLNDVVRSAAATRRNQFGGGGS